MFWGVPSPSEEKNWVMVPYGGGAFVEKIVGGSRLCVRCGGGVPEQIALGNSTVTGAFSLKIN